MSKPRKYTVRTFNPFGETNSFSCTGVMSKLSTYKEEVVDKEFQAVASLAKGNSTPDAVMSQPGTKHKSAMTMLDVTTNPPAGMELLSLNIDTGIPTKSELKNFRKIIMSIIKTWAEKSRVKGVRGWRSNAIKTPQFKMNSDTGSYHLQFDVIFSNAIFYSGNTATITNKPFMEDLLLFKKRLNKELTIDVIAFNHSTYGSGSL